MERDESQWGNEEWSIWEKVGGVMIKLVRVRGRVSMSVRK